MKKRVTTIVITLLMFYASQVFSDSEASCGSCHQGEAADFGRSSKSDKISCVACHGNSHNGPGTGEHKQVTPTTCSHCHEEAVAQFNSGKHSYAWEAMLQVPNYHAMPAAVTQKGCVVCHSIGYAWENGSKGRCDVCHTSHMFSAAEAKKPEVCATCHTGDHPHYDMWASSKHGKLYAIEGDTGRAPACAHCHDTHKVITAWGFLGLRQGDDDDPEWQQARSLVKKTLETMGPALAPAVMRPTFEKWEQTREEMIGRCVQCHSESVVRRELAKSDTLLREADLANAKMITIVDRMYNERLIDDKTRFTMYREATAHRFSAFMGGFHNSANYAWDEGYLMLVNGIVEARDKAISLKKISLIAGLSGGALGIGIVGVVFTVVGILAIASLKRRMKGR